jgi:hypothetical protein
MILTREHPDFMTAYHAALLPYKAPKSETRLYALHLLATAAHLYATDSKRAIRVPAPPDTPLGYLRPTQVNKSTIAMEQTDPEPDAPRYADILDHSDPAWTPIHRNVHLDMCGTEELYYHIITLTGTPWNYKHIEWAVGITGTDSDAHVYWQPGGKHPLIFETDTVTIATMPMSITQA